MCRLGMVGGEEGSFDHVDFEMPVDTFRLQEGLQLCDLRARSEKQMCWWSACTW